MEPKELFIDDLETFSPYDYKGLPNVEIRPRDDMDDAGYKMVNILSNDLALDLTELDLDGLN